MHNSEIYLQLVSIAQGWCLSSMLADIYLYYYECSYIHNSLHLCRHIDNVILIPNDNVTLSIPVAHPSYLKLTENTFENSIINFIYLKLILKNHQVYTEIYESEIIFHLMLTLLLISILV